MGLFDFFKDDAQAVDAIRGGKELREDVETKQKNIQDFLKENPDFLQTNFFSQPPDEITQNVNKLGIVDLVNAGKFFSNPNLATFSPFAPLAITGIASLIRNIQNPYKSAFGGLNTQTKTAISKDALQDFYDRYDKGLVDFTGGITTVQDKARGDKSRNGGGGAHGMEGRAAEGFDEL
tara:strand:- start:7 stop:540 length:534 start_codon:yes stop_codon:yes gene_type:complete